MMRALARWLNAQGCRAADEGESRRALRLYRWAARCDPRWSVPHFNAGLHAKQQCRWEESLRYNERATTLNSDDEGAWWNLGIAATALKDWARARDAWKRLGMDISDGEGEWRWKPVTACVRLNASIGEREVVWGDRLDPARMMVLNVPLPESGRRFREIILHDGAPNGQRTLDGVDVPVFDELQLWRPSEYSTFEVVLEGMDEDAERGLTEICTSRKMGLEDWSTVRFLCAECSTGNPGPHECKVNYQQSDISHWAIAAITEDDVRSAIHELAQQAEVRCVSIALVLKAEPNAAN